VAFGAAKVCSTGFGHASSPQARLLHRLEKVHRVKVTKIDKFCTSQVCSCCNMARLYKSKVHGKRRWVLESCPNCRNEAGTGPKILHHDLHGAMNIRKIFLEEVAGHGRPQCFTRGTERLSNFPSTFHS
jgi:transposase